MPQVVAALTRTLAFLVLGSYVKLDVSAYGGDNKILVQVSGTDMNDVIKAANIEGNCTLLFEAPNNDYYSLFLRNANLPQNDKQVLIKVDYSLYHGIFLISGIVITALGTAIIFYYGVRNKSRNKQIGSNIPGVGY